MNNKKVYFYEEQKMKQIWLVLFIIFLVGIFLYIFVKEVIMKKTALAGSPPVGFTIFMFIIFGVLMPVVMFIAKLITRVEKEGIYIRFFPFHFKFLFFPFDHIQNYYNREYKPIPEYRGWGIRRGLHHGWAYNAYGNQGLQLEMKDGERILIGTQRPDEFVEAIDEVLEKEEKI
ncbi:MAG: DUF6141 family protein [Vulcanimicrobiota bacterium]